LLKQYEKRKKTKSKAEDLLQLNQNDNKWSGKLLSKCKLLIQLDFLDFLDFFLFD